MTTRKRQPPLILECEGCGKPFAKYAAHAKRTKRHFCSHECFFRGLVAHQRQCDYCGSTVKGKVSRWKDKERAFCNHVCYGAWRTANPPTDTEFVTSDCVNCGRPATKLKSEAKRYKHFFCGKECKVAWWAGSNHTHWLGGCAPYYYGPNWSEQRKSARAQVNYKCQRCALSEMELGRKLDIHHIVPFRNFGYTRDENDNYKQANDLNNLLPLCKSCHSIVERITQKEGPLL